MVNDLQLKPVCIRNLKGEQWVAVAANSEVLVIENEKVVNGLQHWDKEKHNIDEETLKILIESGFFVEPESQSETITIPEDKQTIKWKIMRYMLIGIGICSFVNLICLIPFIGVHFGNKIIPKGVALWIVILFCLAVSILSTILHELLHMIYARTFDGKNKGIKLKMKKAMVTVTMSHIWVWKFTSRMVALVAGLVSDLFFLSCLYTLQLFVDSWMLTTASSIMYIRILWQFRFHKNCDGKYIAMSFLDNPVIDIDSKCIDYVAKDALLWKKLEKIGCILEVILILFWLIPFVLKIVEVFLK